ncbi:DUF2007 domain-containing protein [Psychrosphaera sp. 1_MG-2023]|uniref:putative signal transducing protein n=1 Tax=Psychrosphaera sp. 1_MG-2023 TaxID=3062643 RepID=UPI0026E2145D|nr:DUF2007 domain-containing protein [Psychrosphaera sp. 1_MG-2023]MDO6720134.1 DUF2007 domain-containing protein [Psychrosphaera sp. 1_MG-2023]
MKKIFTASNNIELEPYKAMLSEANIKFLVKNEFAMATVGEIPVNESWPQIWAIENQFADNARQLCVELEKTILADKDDWQCQECGENNGGNFEFCWQCGD